MNSYAVSPISLLKNSPSSPVPSYMKPTENSSRSNLVKQIPMPLIATTGEVVNPGEFGNQSMKLRRPHIDPTVVPHVTTQSQLDTSTVTPVDSDNFRYGKARTASPNGTPRFILEKMGSPRNSNNSNCNGNIPKKQQQQQQQQQHSSNQMEPVASNSSHPSNPEAPQASMPSRQCICKICNCGRHHCPQKPQHLDWDKEVDSTYKKNYQNFGPEAIRTSRPHSYTPPHNEYAEGSDLPDRFKSTNKSDFSPPSKESYAQRAKTPTFSSSRDLYSAPFTATTTHRSEYTEKPIEIKRPQSARPAESPTKSNEPFDANSTMKEDYKGWELPAREPAQRIEYNHPRTPFVESTTYQNNYKKPAAGSGPARSSAPPSSGDLPYDHGTERDLLSTHRAEYTPKKIEICPALTIDIEKGIVSPRSGHRYFQS